jgi:8-oxo-dGTP pyrophosphatase MutT (NUDIX family)
MEAIKKVVALVAIQPDKRHVLLVRKNGMLQFPGGKCDPREYEEEALRRECAEEIPGMHIVGDLEYWRGFDPHVGSGYLFGMVAYMGSAEGDVTTHRKADESVTEALWWRVSTDLSELMPVTQEAITELILEGRLVI